MKRRFLIGCFFVTTALVYQACDYVASAVPASTSSTTTTGNASVVYKKVLIEDYTGHKCGNCPAAARELKKLDSIYHGKVVPVAVHAGFYATVNAQYPTDLRCQAGNDYDAFFGNSNAGNPNGLVNRVEYGQASFIKQWGDWGTSAYSLMNMPADFKISIADTFNTVNSTLTATITTHAINAKTGTYNLVVILTEDSIVAEQIDYSLPSGQQFIANYEFNHVLRGALNGSWGQQIVASAIAAGDSVVTTISNYSIPASWKWKKCTLIAYVYDAGTGSSTQYEVLQAETKELD